MTMYDWIFWYSGATVWAIIGTAFLVTVIVSFCVAIKRVHSYQKQWLMSRIICSAEERELLKKVWFKLPFPKSNKSADICKWLEDMHDEYVRVKKKNEGDKGQD